MACICSCQSRQHDTATDEAKSMPEAPLHPQDPPILAQLHRRTRRRIRSHAQHRLTSLFPVITENYRRLHSRLQLLLLDIPPTIERAHRQTQPSSHPSLRHRSIRPLQLQIQAHQAVEKDHQTVEAAVRDQCIHQLLIFPLLKTRRGALR